MKIGQFLFRVMASALVAFFITLASFLVTIPLFVLFDWLLDLPQGGHPIPAPEVVGLGVLCLLANAAVFVGTFLWVFLSYRGKEPARAVDPPETFIDG